MRGRPPLEPRIKALEERLDLLEHQVLEVMADHEAGLLRSTGPIVRRGRNVPREAKTAIISDAAERAIADREFPDKPDGYVPLFDRWPGHGRP